MAASFDALKRRRPSTTSFSDVSLASDHQTKKKQRMLPPSPPAELNPFNAPTILALERMFDRVVELAKKPSLATTSSTPFSSSLLSATGRSTAAHHITKPQSNDTIAAFQPPQLQQRQQAVSSGSIRAHTNLLPESNSNRKSSSSHHKYRYLHPPFSGIKGSDVSPATASTSEIDSALTTQPATLRQRSPPSTTPHPSSVAPSVPSESRVTAAPPSSIPADTVELIESDDEHEGTAHRLGDEEEEDEDEYESRSEDDEEDAEELWIEDGSNDEVSGDERGQEDIIYEGLDSEVEEEDEGEDLPQVPQHFQDQVVDLLSSDDESEEDLAEEVEEAEEELASEEEEEADEDEAGSMGVTHHDSMQLVGEGFAQDNLDQAEEEEEEREEYDHEETETADDEQVVIGIDDEEEGAYDNEEEAHENEEEEAYDNEEEEANDNEEEEAAEVDHMAANFEEEDEYVGTDISDMGDEQSTEFPVAAIAAPSLHLSTITMEASVSSTTVVIEEDGYDEPSLTEYNEELQEEVQEGDGHLDDIHQERWPLQIDNASHQEDEAYAQEEENERNPSEAIEDQAGREEAEDETSIPKFELPSHPTSDLTGSDSVSVVSDHESKVEEELEDDTHLSQPDLTAHPVLQVTTSDSVSVVSNQESEDNMEEESLGPQIPDDKESNVSQPTVLQHARPTMWQRPVSDEPEAAIVLDDSDEEESMNDDVADDDDMEGLSTAEDDYSEEEVAHGADEEEVTGDALDRDESDHEAQYHPADDDITTSLVSGGTQDNQEEPKTDVMASTTVFDENDTLSNVEADSTRAPQLRDDGGYFEKLEAAYVQVQAEEEQQLAGQLAEDGGSVALPFDVEQESALLPVAMGDNTIDPNMMLDNLQAETIAAATAVAEATSPIRSPPKTRLVRTGTMLQTIRDGALYLQQLDERAAKSRFSSTLSMTNTTELLSTPSGSITESPFLINVAHNSVSMAPASPQEYEAQQAEQETGAVTDEMEKAQDEQGVASPTTIDAAEESSLQPNTTTLVNTDATTDVTTATAAIATATSKPMSRELMQLVMEARNFCQKSSPSVHSGEMMGGGERGSTSSPAIRRAISVRPFSRRRGSAHSDQEGHTSGMAEGGEGAESSSMTSGSNNTTVFGSQEMPPPPGQHGGQEGAMEPGGGTSLGMVSSSSSSWAGVSTSSTTALGTPSLSSSLSSSSGVVDLAAERVIESTLVGNHALRAFIHPPPTSPIRSPSRASASLPNSSNRMASHGSRSGSVERTIAASSLGGGGSHGASAVGLGFGHLPPPPPSPFPAAARMNKASQQQQQQQQQAATTGAAASATKTALVSSPFRFGAGAAETESLKASTGGPAEVGFSFGMQSVATRAPPAVSPADNHPASTEAKDTD